MTGPAQVLIPTRDRPDALAVTLAGLAGQSVPVRVLVADQSQEPVAQDPLVRAMARVVEDRGGEVVVHRRVLRRGVAEQRDHLVRASDADELLCLDDDVWLHPWAVATLREALAELGCGFVGMAVAGLSHRHDVRPAQQRPFRRWDGPVRPERVRRGTEAWDRHLVHNAANMVHLAQREGATPRDWVAYRVAWIGGCVLYRRRSLLEAGGFGFWRRLPPVHAGEDVVAQLRVLERSGGAGILPSGAVHLELPTTVGDRGHEAYDLAGPGAGEPA